MKNAVRLAGVACVLATSAFAAPPQVVSVHPARNRIDAPTNSNIQVEFDTDIDAATVDGASLRVFGRWSGPATGAYTVAEGTVTFVPDAPFFAGETVTVAMSKAIENLAGEVMVSGYAWSFWIESGQGTLDLDYVTRYSTRRTGETWVQPYGAYAGDLDNDGWSDLFIPCEQTDDVRIFLNDGAGGYGGGFVAETLLGGNTPSPNEGADLDHDGEIDVVVGNHANNQVSIMFGDGTGDFPVKAQYTADTQVRGVAVLDLDGDGWDDLVVASRAGSGADGNLSIFINNGDGTFAPRVNFEAGVVQETSLAVGDANNDGILDVYVGNFGIPRSVTVLLGDGNGSLVAQTPVATSGQPWMLATGDVNGDGNVDVFSANSNGNGIGLHLGDGAGGISAVSTLAVGLFPLAIDAGDIDGDGDLDLVSSNYASGSWTIYENTGTGLFVNPRTRSASAAGSCATLHDRDNDGDLDLTGLDEVDDWVYLFENDASSTHVPPVARVAATMAQNQPNPFNPSTTIRFELGLAGPATLSVFDATGAFVATIASGRYEAGPHEVAWNGTDAEGRRVASGAYFYRLTANGVEIARKMMLLK